VSLSCFPYIAATLPVKENTTSTIWNGIIQCRVTVSFDLDRVFKSINRVNTRYKILSY
jgi:hypothetical protein